MGKKISLYSWFLFLEPQKLRKIKRKSQVCACQKTNEAFQELLRSAVTYMAVLPNFKHLLQILDELNTNQMVVKKVVIKVNREQFIANYFSKTNKKMQSLF